MNEKNPAKKELLFFDPEWYLEQNPDVEKAGINPLNHFITNGWKEGRNPSKHFDVNKYIEENPEMLPINMQPFLHIEFVSNNSTLNQISFPAQATEIVETFKSLDKEKEYKRVIVFASFIADGIIPAHLVYFLSKLKKISDAIIFIADNPILPSEAKKLAHSVNHISFTRHEEYDFGSYKRGIDYVKEHLGLENIEELVLCNDSCFGPIFPFEEMFDTMAQKELDFWGITKSPEIYPHLQSYFLVFNNKVITHKAFNDYFNAVQKEESRSRVILKYELLLADKLSAEGFKYDAFIANPSKELYENGTFKHLNITTYPAYMMRQKSPLVKLKHFYDPMLNYDGTEKSCLMFKEINPAAYRIVEEYLEEKLLAQKNPQQSKSKKVPELELRKLKMLDEIRAYQSKFLPMPIFQESKIIHKYLDGLNGIEIGASSHNPFGLEKTGGYANVDYSAAHGNLWQPGSTLAPAKVNIVAQGDDLPFKDESLDYVVSSHALEHFFDPIKAIKEWFRVVKKGGYVAMIIPHKDRTFDCRRATTPVQELFDRHSGKLAHKNYIYRTNVEASDTNPLPPNFIQITEECAPPAGYAPFTNSVDIAHLHISVWNTESFVELCQTMQWNMVEVQDVDDKAHNGFLIILQK